MAVRYRKYFNQCKEIRCNGRQSKHCPSDRPRNAQNNQYRKCGQWVVELFDETKKWQSLVFKDVRSKADADKRFAVMIADRERGKLNLSVRKTSPLLEEYCDKYLHSIANNTKENTLLHKKRAIKALIEGMGNYRLNRITPFIIEKYRVDRQKTGLKPQSINTDVFVLSHIMSQALKEGLISKNPCSEVKRLKVTGKRDRILSDSEIDLILNKLEGKDRLMVLVSLFTGMRLNEVLGLTWNDIDFENRIISIVQSKTGKLVKIPLSNFIAGELWAYKTTDGRVFDAAEVNKRLVVRYSNHFSRLFKNLGIQGFTFHNLRHSFASLQCGIGTDIVTTQSLLGHSDITQTMRYSHSQVEAKRIAIDNVEKYILESSTYDKSTAQEMG